MKKKISFIVPVFNEAENIFPLYEQLQSILIFLSSSFDFEIIFIDDGSTDHSWLKIVSLYQLNKNIYALRFSRNFGKEMAITAGYDVAQGDAVITMDGDLQHPVEVIPQMIEKWEEGIKIVYTRNKNHYESKFKKIAAYCHYKLLNQLASFSVPQYVQDFRLIDRHIIQILRLSQHRARYLRGMIASTGFKAAYIDVVYAKRFSGKSTLSIIRLLRISFDAITSFSSTPLRIAIFFSIFFLILSCMTLISFFLVSKGNYQIKISLIFFTIFFFVSGLIFGCFWLLGEYIGRIYDELKDTPLYVVESKCGELNELVVLKSNHIISKQSHRNVSVKEM